MLTFSLKRLSIELKWFAVIRGQFMFQGSGKDSFMINKKFSYLPLDLRSLYRIL